MQSSRRTWSEYLSIALGFVLLGLLVAVVLNLRRIVAHIDTTPLTILTIAAAYVLYAIRKLRPLAYGITELLIGALVILLATLQAPEVFKDEAAVWALAVQLAAGIYIVIRGLDNMARSPLWAGNDRARAFFECRWWRKWKE
jgi:hypothetical protein